jgi:hypothetical protein
MGEARTPTPSARAAATSAIVALKERETIDKYWSLGFS